MDKRFHADELVKLSIITTVGTLYNDDQAQLTHMRHLIERLLALDLTLTSVLEAGMARLLRLSEKDIDRAWERRPFVYLVSTENWREQALFHLRMRGDTLSNADRTYLEMVTSRRGLMATDMLELEQVLRRAFEGAKNVNWGERMEEFRSPADEATPPEQLDLDV